MKGLKIKILLTLLVVVYAEGNYNSLLNVYVPIQNRHIDTNAETYIVTHMGSCQVEEKLT